MKQINLVRNLSTKQKLFILALGGFVLLMVFVLFFSTKDNEKTVSISGISSLAVPTERKGALEKTLYNVLADALPGESRIGGAAVRKDSYRETYDALTNIHNASLIVDIPSIRQSYLAHVEWSNNPDNPNLSGYPAVIQCAPKELLRYGEFTCSLRNAAEDSGTADIIGRYLPYHVESKFKVTGSKTSKTGTVTLGVEAYLPGSVSKMTPEILSQYTTEIEGWIRSIGLNPSAYGIEYQY